MINLFNNIKNNKRFIYFISTLIGLVCIMYAYNQIKAYSNQIDLLSVYSNNLVILFLLIIVYSTSHFTISYSWGYLVNKQSYGLGFIKIFLWHSSTQIFKYLPGFFFQHLGRHVTGTRIGISNERMIKALLYDIIFVILAVIPFIMPALIYYFFNLNNKIFFLMPIIFILMFFGIKKFFFINNGVKFHLVFLGFFLTSAIFFLVFSSCMLLVTKSYISPDLIIYLGMIYILAWIIGVLAIGIPAGIGVREGAAIFFTQNIDYEGSILSAIILMRIISVVGDILIFLATSPLSSQIFRKEDNI